MATTPVGSGSEKLKYGPATGLAEPATWANLSAQPAYQTMRSIDSPTLRERLVGRPALGRGDLGGELLPTAVEHLGHAVDHLAAVVGGRGRPAREGLARRDDSVAHVLARGLGGVREQRAGGVVDRVGAARLRARERAADRQLVGLAHAQARPRSRPQRAR